VAIEHVQVPIQVNFDITKTINAESIAAAIAEAYPKDPNLTVVGLTIPLLSIVCKDQGIIDPISDIKNAISRVYDYLSKAIIEIVWNTLYKVYNVIKVFIGDVLDLSLGILNLKVSDLFNPDLYGTIERTVKDLYATSKATLDQILSFLNIPTPAFADVHSPEKEIEHFVKSILSSLWTQLWKKVEEIRNLINTGLGIWDQVNKTKPFPTQPFWQSVVDAVLGKYLDLIKNPPTMQQIEDALKDFARGAYQRAEVRASEILAVLKRFTLPIVGFPLDWNLPLNPRVHANSIDLAQIISDIKIWLNNFVTNLVQKFVNAITKLLSLFGIPVPSFPPIPIPLTACAIHTY
jgi:phage-related protein